MINTNPIDLNIKFNGSYPFFVWILKKYKSQLPYNGEVKQFALQNNYCPKMSCQWRNYGVGFRVWNILHKDLTIAFLINKIEIANVYELEKIFNESKKKEF